MWSRSFVLVALAGCYKPGYDDCAILCGQSSACPAGLSCQNGYCRPAARTGECTDSGTVIDTFVNEADLVFWYSFDTLTNGTVVDTSGHGHTAHCDTDRCPTVVPGVWGHGYHFDGADDIVVVDPSPDLSTPAGYSVSLWINADTQTPIACLANKILLSTTNSWQLCVQGDSRLVHITQGDDLYEGPNITYQTWLHVVIRWDGQEKTTWVNGTLQSTLPRNSTAFDNGTVALGADLNGGTPSDFFLGSIDEVRLYARPLTFEEIVALARPPSP